MDSQMSMALWVATHDKEWVKEYHYLLDADSLPRGPAQWLVAAVVRLWMEDHSLLTPEVMILLFEENSSEFQLHGTTPEEAAAFYLEVHERHVEDKLAQGKRQNVAMRWFRQMSLTMTIDAVQALSEAGDTEGAIRASRQVERLAAGGGGKPGITLVSDAPPPLRPAIHTGFEELDRKWRGGIHQGQLGMVVAPSNQGKSMLLPVFVAEALRQNKNILVYSTELSEGVWLERVMSAYLDVSIDAIDEKFEDYRQIMATRLTRLEEMSEEETFFTKGTNTERYIEIRYRDAGTLTTIKIESDLEELQEKGIRIHMIVLDGDDIGVAFDKKYDKAYDMYYYIYDQLSALAKKKDIVIWTAAQAKREAFRRERQRDDDVGDSLWKYRKSDLVLGIAQPSDNKKGDLLLDGAGKPYVVMVVAKDRYFSSKNFTVKRQARFGDRVLTDGVCGFSPYVAKVTNDE